MNTILEKRRQNLEKAGVSPKAKRPHLQQSEEPVMTIECREEMSKKAFNQAEDILERIRTRSELRKSKHKSNQQKFDKQEKEKESDNGSMANTENQQG